MTQMLCDIAMDYYNAHQISKSVNLLDIALTGTVPRGVQITNCICNFLEPEGGWNRFITGTNSKNEKCYYCLEHISKMFPEFRAANSQYQSAGNCKNCYIFMCQKYVSQNGKVNLSRKLTAKKR